MKPKPTILCLLAFLLHSLPAWALTSNQLKEITFQNYVEPLFPYELIFEGIVEGSVSIAIDINEDGTVADWLPISSSHDKFTGEIARVIDKWVFIPFVKDGVATPYISQIQFHFSHQGVTFSGGNLTALFLNQISARKTDNRFVFNLSELDQIPTPVELVHPKQVLDEDGKELSGQVLVEFFIDPEGNVRLPVVREIDGSIDLAHSAYQAISNWKFEPPLRNGRPVTARVRQPIVFSSDK